MGTLDQGSATIQNKFVLFKNGRKDVPNVPYSKLGIVLCQVNLCFYGVWGCLSAIWGGFLGTWKLLEHYYRIIVIYYVMCLGYLSNYRELWNVVFVT